jgi:DNA-binding NarL/FixJ family response regulator
VRQVAGGLSYKQIAEQMNLSHRTIQNHVQSILKKLQLRNRTELVRYAVQHSLVDD